MDEFSKAEKQFQKEEKNQVKQHRQSFSQSNISNYHSKLGVSQNFYKNSIFSQSETPNLWNQSSSTWRNSCENYSFSKGDRFHIFDLSKRRIQINLEDTRLEKIQFTSQLSRKFCTLGKGEKQYQSQSELRNAREIPPPGYTQQVVNKIHVRNVSLGTQRRFLKESKKIVPPVGNYQISEIPGKDKLKFSIYGRIKASSEHQDGNMPAANHYSPLQKLVENQKFNQITFGKGRKFDFENKKVNFVLDYDVPGPGSYNPGSKFDKFNKALKGWQSPFKQPKRQNQMANIFTGHQKQQQQQQNSEQKLDEQFNNMEQEKFQN